MPTRCEPESPEHSVEPAKALRIGGLGVACIDYLFRAPDVRPGGQAALSDYAVEGGGLVATALVAAARLGAHTEVRTWVGDDDEGGIVLSGLNREGVDTNSVTVLPGAQTTVSFVHVTEATGERTIYHRSGPAPTQTQMTTTAMLAVEYDAVLVDAV